MLCQITKSKCILLTYIHVTQHRLHIPTMTFFWELNRELQFWKRSNPQPERAVPLSQLQHNYHYFSSFELQDNTWSSYFLPSSTANIQGEKKRWLKTIKIKPNKSKHFYNVNYAPFDDSTYLRQLRVWETYTKTGKNMSKWEKMESDPWELRDFAAAKMVRGDGTDTRNPRLSSVFWRLRLNHDVMEIWQWRRWWAHTSRIST